jgi:hypothetical protein
MSFFAILSYDFKGKVVKTPGKVGQSYSAFIRCSQLILIQWAYTNAPKESPDEVEGGWQGAMAKAIKDFMKEYFHHESTTALGSLLAFRALALSISKQETGAYHDITLLDAQTLSFKNLTLGVDQVTDLFQKVVLEASQILFDRLLIRKEWGVELMQGLTLDLAASGENINQGELGFSFASSPELDRFQDFLMKKLIYDELARQQWFSQPGEYLWLNMQVIY